MYRDIWRYRLFIIGSIHNELISRFSRNKLGGLWAILNPLMQVLIFSLILSNLLAPRLPGVDNVYAYAIYLMAGQLSWTLFSDIILRGMGLFIERAELLKKMKFPRITLPCILVGSALLNNLLLALAILIIFSLLGYFPAITVLWLPLLSVLVVVMALGVGILLGILNVFIRDVGQIVPIIMQVWFWFTPIIYPESIIPAKYLPWLAMNPMTPVVRAYHNVLVYGKPPQLDDLIAPLLVGFLLLFACLFLFRRANLEMVDAL